MPEKIQSILIMLVHYTAKITENFNVSVNTVVSNKKRYSKMIAKATVRSKRIHSLRERERERINESNVA